MKKPDQTISLEPIDKVTIVELEEGEKVRLGLALNGENRITVLELLKVACPLLLGNPKT